MSRKDRSEYNAYMREYMRRRYHERVEEAKDLLGGKCVRCGSTEDLEFDHIDPEDKSFNITRLSAVSKERLQAELAKCQLLCHACHTEKTVTSNGKQMAKGTHGTLSAYRYCRCDLCRKAKRDYNRIHAARRRERAAAA